MPTATPTPSGIDSTLAQLKYIGLMSLTSMDAVDATLVAFYATRTLLLAAHSHPFPESLRHRVIGVMRDPVTLHGLGPLDTLVRRLFAKSVEALLGSAGVNPSQVTGIGSHVQTIYHHPDGAAP